MQSNFDCFIQTLVPTGWTNLNINRVREKNVVSSEKFERVKVLIVDDHKLFAEGTVSLLRVESRILTVGIAKNGIECMGLISKTVPDVVLLDINLPDICGIDIIEKIKKFNPM